MWGYLLKRLLLVVPTVWLIGSLVFLISKIIPGQYSDVIIETEQATIGGVNLQLDQKAYLLQLKESGQDKPLFYFSVRSRAQPDTLYRVFPVQHQKLLQELLYRYGHWPSVAAYYNSLENLKAVADPEQQYRDKKLLGALEKVQLLYQTSNPEESLVLLREIPAENTHLQAKIGQVQECLVQMQQQARPLNLFIPQVRWHGPNNQYHTWLLGIIKGDMGHSYRFRQPVLQVIGEAIGNTLVLLAGSLVLTFAISIKLALALCRWRNGRSMVLNTLYLLDSTPLFLVALLLLTYLAGSEFLNIFPVFGLGEDDSSVGWFQTALTRLHHLLLPAICLIITSLPYITTQLYQVLQQVLTTPFITTARAKGLTEVQVLQKHAFRNALLPLITLFTGYLPAIISGAVVIEVIFAIPGTGRLLVDSVLARDYPVIIGLVLFIAALQAISHVLADFFYFAADPRTRLKPA